MSNYGCVFDVTAGMGKKCTSSGPMTDEMMEMFTHLSQTYGAVPGKQMLTVRSDPQMFCFAHSIAQTVCGIWPVKMEKIITEINVWW